MFLVVPWGSMGSFGVLEGPWGSFRVSLGFLEVPWAFFAILVVP